MGGSNLAQVSTN